VNPITSFIEWVIQPLLETSEPTINKSKLSTVNTILYRPAIFNEYIGQENTKLKLSKYITGVKQRNLIFPHTLILGPSGMGKTTLTKVLANELKVPIISNIASEIITTNHLIDLIYDVNEGIVFLDEIHSMPREIAEKLYPMMEDFQFKGQNLPYFTLVGATTELGEILKNRKPFVYRFKQHLELEKYNIQDLIKIVRQYKEHAFPNEIIREEIYEIIARNARNNPRTLISLLEATIYFNGDIGAVLETCNIIKDGFTRTDIKLLVYLAYNPKGVGLESITGYLDTSAINYKYEIEPYLLQEGMILKTGRGRIISDQGILFLQRLGVKYV